MATALKRGPVSGGFLLATALILLALVLALPPLYRLSLAAPLRVAISAQDTAAAARLLRQGAPVNAPDGDGRTPLSLAFGPNDSSGIGGDPATHTLIAPSLPVPSEQIVVLLLKAGADPKETTSGKPYLLLALDHHSLAAVQALLAYGADPNATYMQSPMLMQAVQDDADFQQLGKEKTPLFTQTLLAAGADARVHRPYPGDGFSGTLYEELPLIEAVRDLPNDVYSGNASLIETLLARGADVNGRDHAGRTALFVAAANGNPVIVHSLLMHGAAPGVADWQGHTPLQLAQEADRGWRKSAQASTANWRIKEGNARGAQRNALIHDQIASEEWYQSVAKRYAVVERLLAGVKSPTTL